MLQNNKFISLYNIPIESKAFIKHFIFLWENQALKLFKNQLLFSIVLLREFFFCG